MTVIVALLNFVLSVTEVAVSITVAGVGMVDGPLYVTDVDVAFISVPHVLPLQPAPESVHVTPLFWTSLVNCAVKFCVPKIAATLALAGEMLPVMGRGGVSLAHLKTAEIAPQLSAAPIAPLAQAC